MSIFGGGAPNNQSVFSTQPNPLQAQPTIPALLGNTNTNTNTNTSNTNTGAGLFGGATSNQPTNIFGSNSNTTNANPLGGQAQSTNTNPLFGNTNTSNPSNPTPTNIFGSTNVAPQQGQANPLFGGSGNTSTTTNSNTNPLFGGAANTATNTNTSSGTGTGMFSLNTNTGTSIFGTPKTATGTTNTAPTTNTNPLFGQTNTNNAGGGGATTGGNFLGSSTLFGGSKTGTGTATGTNTNTGTNANLYSGFLGQQPQQQQQQQQPSSLFGSSASNPLFGSTTNNPLFGCPPQSTNVNPLTSSALAPLNTNTLLGPSKSTTIQPQSLDSSAQFVKLTQGIEKIQQSWDPSNRNCRFQFGFYNLVDPSQVQFYGRPQNALNDEIWAKAVQNNPDPSCLVPVIAIGFEDLRARTDAQAQQSSSHLQKLADLKSRLAALKTQHDVSNAPRIAKALAMQTQLAQRLMQIVQYLHLLIPSLRSSAVSREEEGLRGKLEALEEEMRRQRVMGRLNELWALLGALSASRVDRVQGEGPRVGAEWAVVDEEGLGRITQILTEVQAGLQHLTRIVQKDQRDLSVIMGTGRVHDLGDPEDLLPLPTVNQSGGNKTWGMNSTLSTSMLR